MSQAPYHKLVGGFLLHSSPVFRLFRLLRLFRLVRMLLL